MYAKFFKYEFWLNEVVFLRHVVFGNGIFIDPRKVKAIVKLERLKNVTEIRSFLGLIEYYRWFVEHFSLIAAPLTQLTQKASNFSNIFRLFPTNYTLNFPGIYKNTIPDTTCPRNTTSFNQNSYLENLAYNSQSLKVCRTILG